MNAFPFSLALSVYWEDTDAGGVVYHASYLRFLERARTEWFRSLGVFQSTLGAAHDLVFAIRSMSIEFRLPARLDDRLEVRVDAVRMGRASLHFRQSVWRQEAGRSELLLTAAVRAACLSASRFKPRVIPEHLRRLLPAEVARPERDKGSSRQEAKE
ncbi:MAG: tol-pal system-associated acyl-CoA thioesterase [Lysobacteraceae bacterium]|nr:MAG: tol-pal system-associated acyl-CoA thioesterase [Xanthomonadaceae bacterium]